MNKNNSSALPAPAGKKHAPRSAAPLEPVSVKAALEALGTDFKNYDRLLETLPFSVGDVTAGSESELQAAVIGDAANVDMALAIRTSSFFSNAIQRQKTGETSKRLLTDIEDYLDSNPEQVWENSWVRFPHNRLSPLAKKILSQDLRANKNDPHSGLRGDFDRFFFKQHGEAFCRLPVSYLLKLALADFLDRRKSLPPALYQTGILLLDHFLNDNTSPETHSFYISALAPDEGNGKSVARETCQRFLFTQLLIQYANLRFGLKERGQEAIVFHSPHPPIRQKKLNQCIPDSFYRELFMSPCLSGWDRGEEKHAYMSLCHEVLSRSQLNTLAKLREAGLITRNLVTLPNTSNISLANNGTHLSMSSQRMTAALKAQTKDFTGRHEKYIGDLAIKVFEHFLSLFVGQYSAAPYRMEFFDFHPETALGFLPHQLHYTHLRMIWRRWHKKAKLKIFNKPITPFGPRWLDKIINDVFGFRGDVIPDFRLVDYMVALLSTEGCPMLDGKPGNLERLAKDLMHLGVFHEKMSPYMFYRLRQFASMGYSGFEGRYYSLFENITEDMGEAADLQNLITLLAFKLVATGRVTHASIPDTPFVESERRQVAFGAAIGIPTFYVRGDTGNLFLKNLVRRTAKVRASSRYPGYFRVQTQEYKKALLIYLKEEAGDLVSLLNMQETLGGLAHRINDVETGSAAGRITQGILNEAGTHCPFKLSAWEMNSAAEAYYRNGLRRKHIQEGLDGLKEAFSNDRDFVEFITERFPGFLKTLDGSPNRFFEDAGQHPPSYATIRVLLEMILMHTAYKTSKFEHWIDRRHTELHDDASVY